MPIVITKSYTIGFQENFEKPYILFLMLITSLNDNLIMFSENITVILKFTIDIHGTPVSLLSLTINFCQSVVSF